MIKAVAPLSSVRSIAVASVDSRRTRTCVRSPTAQAVCSGVDPPVLMTLMSCFRSVGSSMALPAIQGDPLSKMYASN